MGGAREGHGWVYIRGGERVKMMRMWVRLLVFEFQNSGDQLCTISTIWGEGVCRVITSLGLL